MQWLNDPLALAFTALLLIGATALLAGGTFAVQPLVGAAVFVPFVFLLFAIARFLWALRVREQCSLAEAIRALTVLLGLTWVVTLACARGLVSRQGVSLRTPKQGGVADIREAFAIVRWEFLLGLVCIASAVALIVNRPLDLLSARAVVILLVFWQSAIYLSAVVTSAWDYRQRRGRLAPTLLGLRTLGPAIGRTLSEPQTAVWVGIAILVVGQLLYLATEHASPIERLFRADPLRQFLAAPSVLSATPEERAGAMLVVESDAARRGDVEAALSLWSPNGVIVDQNFRPADTENDSVWRGPDGLRARYTREFKQRRYLSLNHLNLEIKIEDGYATITNDLDAVVQSGRSKNPERIHLPQSDRWILQEVDGRWQIVRLEVNRALKTIPEAMH